MEMQAVEHDPFAVPTQAVDHDPFAPGFEAVDHNPFSIDQERIAALSGLNPVQRSMLGVLSLAEKVGAPHQTAIKLYNDVVQRGRTAPISENDLSQNERGQLRALVEGHAKSLNVREGRVDYPDYGKFSPDLDQNILGGFRYAIGDGGDINIQDTYDFNANRADQRETSIGLQALALLANPRGLAAQIGRQIIPDTGGRGVPVNIRLQRPLLQSVDHDPFAEQ